MLHFSNSTSSISGSTATVEVEVFADDGIVGRASVPSGASTGVFEAVEERKEAVKLLDQETFYNKDLFGSWKYDDEAKVTRGTYTDVTGEVKEDVERNLVEFNG